MYLFTGDPYTHTHTHTHTHTCTCVLIACVFRYVCVCVYIGKHYKDYRGYVDPIIGKNLPAKKISLR